MEGTSVELKIENVHLTQPQAYDMVAFKAEKVDMTNRMIEGVVMCQTGEARGHGVHIEESFLLDLTKFVNSGGGAVKSNFNHNWDNMGLQLGRFTNVRLSGKKVVGDLHIYNAADDSPKMPKMGTYILNMAKEAPDAVMCSIVFMPKYYYQYDADNKEVIMKNYDWWEGKFENQDIKKKMYPKFGELFSTDLVADGAVTKSLFSNPNIPQKMSETTDKEPTVEELQVKLAAAEEQIAELKKKEVTDPPAADPAKTEVPQTNAEFAALKKEITELSAKITKLEKGPAGEHSDSASEGDDPPAKKEVKMSEVTRKANERYQRSIKSSQKSDK